MVVLFWLFDLGRFLVCLLSLIWITSFCFWYGFFVDSRGCWVGCLGLRSLVFILMGFIFFYSIRVGYVDLFRELVMKFRMRVFSGRVILLVVLNIF